MTPCLLGMGSNLGDRQQWLTSALERLRADGSVRLIAASRWHASAAVGGATPSAPYLNGVAWLETDRSAHDLLQLLLRTEAALGRQRQGRWSPRTVDLDLLLYGQEVIDAPGLTVPHPWMALRRFVAEPAAEIAPHWRHPRLGWSLREIWHHLRQATPRIAVAGCQRRSAQQAVQRVAARCGVACWAPPAARWRLPLRSMPVPGQSLEFRTPALRWLEDQVSRLPRHVPVMANVGKVPGSALLGAAEGRPPVSDESRRSVWDVVVIVSRRPFCPARVCPSGGDRSAADAMPCPWLWIPRGDLGRLEHDLQALLQGLRAGT